MKFDTKWVLCIVVAVCHISWQARADALTEILRTAALKNGLRPTVQSFDPRDAELAPVGKTFFESKNVSLNGNIACRTCHLDQFSSADGLPNAVGIFGHGEGPIRAKSEGKIVPRNTLPLWGRGSKGFDTFFWDGKVDFSGDNRISQFGSNPPDADALLTAVHLPPLEIREMLSDDSNVARFKQEDKQAASTLMDRLVEHLVATETEAMRTLAHQTGKNLESLSFTDVARSIAAFIRSEFRLRDTIFHKFVFGQASLSQAELDGGLIFYGKGKCVNCHNGPFFSDLQFHAIPFPQLGFGKNGFGVDYGRFNVTFNPDDLYRFRTPPLINVTTTTPYGHSGSVPTLREAIMAHFDPLRLIDQKNMDALTRHEFFRRMAASRDSMISLSYLDDAEISQLERFLAVLSFK